MNDIEREIVDALKEPLADRVHGKYRKPKRRHLYAGHGAPHRVWLSHQGPGPEYGYPIEVALKLEADGLIKREFGPNIDCWIAA